MSRPKRNPEPAPKITTRNRAWLVCGFLLLLAGVVFFLPAILVNSPLKQSAIDWATSDLQGKLQVEQISAGWLSPLELNGIALKDSQDNEVVSIERIATSQTLLGLLSGQYDKVLIQKPSIDLELRDDGSNLEDILVNYLSQETDTTDPTAIPKLSVQIEDGVIGLRSTLIPDRRVVENLAADIQVSGDDAPLIADVRLRARDNGGVLEASITVDPGQTEITGDSINLTANSNGLPLSTFAPLLTRAIGPANMAGVIDGRIDMHVKKDAAEIALSNFEASQIAIIAPEFLGSDQISAQKLTTSGSINTNFQRIYAENFKAECEFARLSADGNFDLDQISRMAEGQELPHSNFQLDGIFDLAQITAMLPETTHIRDDVKMNSGLLQVTATARHENGAPRLVFNADAANMNFNVNGQQVTWNKPLRTVAVAAVKRGQLALNDIQLQSDFLNVDGNASWTDGQLNLRGDLQKVMNQLGQIIDTGDMALAGIADGRIRWQSSVDLNQLTTNQPVPIRLVGKFKIKNPRIQYPGLNPWQEKELDIALNSNVTVTTSELKSIDSAIVNTVIGNEMFKATLKQPANDFMSTGKLQFDCAAKGSIAKWIAQARNFSTFPEFFCDGQLQSNFMLTVNPQAIRLNQIEFGATDFQFDGFALNIREPKITGRGNLKYNLANGKIEFLKTRVSSPSFAATTDQIDLDVTQKILIDGIVNFRADADRASNWIGLSLPGDSVRWDGDASGTITFKSDNNRFGGDLSAKIDQMFFVQPLAASAPNTNTNQLVGNQTRYSEIWREPKLTLTSNIELSDDFNRLKLTDLELKSKTADIKLDGTINNLATDLQADLKGQWKVQWDAVNKTVRELAGDVITFSGSQWQPLRIQGPLYTEENYQWVPNQLAAFANISWEQAELYNLPLGNNQIDLRIDQSLANLNSTANTNLVDRVFALQPVIDLRTADPIIYLNEGALLDNWQVKSSDSRTWLKYAAPLIADATSTEGHVSAKLDGAAVPIFDPMKASAKGTLQLHELNVGAGPMVQQLIPLIDQVRSVLSPEKGNYQQDAWLQLKPQELPFLVKDGRVHHSDFEMNYKDVIVRTSGSVGFDQSLNMVAEIPISAEWLGSNKTLARLAGKSISIPIGGNLSRPQMDRRAVTQFVSQTLKDTAIAEARDRVQKEVGNLNEKTQDEINKFQNKVNDKIQNELRGELQKGFDKLFGGG